MVPQPERAESLQSSAAEHARCIASILEVLYTESVTRRDKIRAKWVAALLTDTRLLEQSLELLAGEEVRC